MEVLSDLREGFLSTDDFDIPTPFRSALDGKSIAVWNPPGSNTTTLPGVFGTIANTFIQGTATARSMAFTSLVARQPRLGYVSAATAGSICGQYSAGRYTTGLSDPLGGFCWRCRFMISDPSFVTGARMFVGLSGNFAPSNVDPPTLSPGIGVAQIDGSANLNIVISGGTVVDTLMPLDLTSVFEVEIMSNPNKPYAFVRVTRLNDGAVSSAFSNPGIASSVVLSNRAWRSNNATASVVGIDVCYWSSEQP
jgi:hypothetical protein